MLTRDVFASRFSTGVHLLDGATGTALRAAGMPRGCCAEAWILDHPQVIMDLQRAYVKAGSEIIYAPTFRAQPMALAAHGLAERTEEINRRLIALSRKAAPDCLIAGNLTTLRGCIDTSDPANLSRMTADYQRQIAALAAGDADLLAAETLMHPLEAQAILKAAAAEQVEAVMISFACRPDGTLYAGHSAVDALRSAEEAGAAAVGVNCIAAEDGLPGLIARLRRHIRGPLLCKPNAGHAVQGVYPVSADRFAQLLQSCAVQGASLIGGCCGTDPTWIHAVRQRLLRQDDNILDSHD